VSYVDEHPVIVDWRYDTYTSRLGLREQGSLTGVDNGFLVSRFAGRIWGEDVTGSPSADASSIY
jgi:hypothetical protein